MRKLFFLILVSVVFVSCQKELDFYNSLPGSPTVSSDVYITGYDGNSAVVWKNGISSALANGAYPAYAYSIFVSGTDVFAAGTEFNGSGWAAKFWKNGVETSLTNGNFTNIAPSVFVSDPNVYIAGTITSVPETYTELALPSFASVVATPFFQSIAVVPKVPPVIVPAI